MALGFGAIDFKWQKKWEEAGIFTAKPGKKKKYYVLEMYPYPSSSGLHMGHVRNYSLGDSFARFKRMCGFSVLYPMGYDSFGLPAENAAIKSKSHPRKYTDKAIANIRKEQKALGFSYDWDREIASHNPDYYKWNQWFFLKAMEMGLVYKKKSNVNWCPGCKTVLANEQVEAGACWRCKSVVEEKDLEQWFFRITKYADRLLEGLDKIQWPEKVKTMQRNWIGKSHGVIEKWKVDRMDLELETFTTEPHTTYGASFMVLAPEHPLVMKLVKGTKYEKGAKEFIKKCKRFRVEDPTNTEKQKEGFFIGKYVINHLNKRKMPLYIANFAIMDYGTGIVKCTPTHDQRDFEFAKKYGLDLYPVINPPGKKLDPKTMKQAYTKLEVGKMANAGKFTGMDAAEAKKRVADHTEKIGHGKKVTNYKLRDWLVSRQRYWGTPIPIIYCKKCGTVPVPYKDLPVKLPKDAKFTGKGNPLETSKSFSSVKCPKCKSSARRETDTMDTFVDSSWFFLRYCSPKFSKGMFDPKEVGYWMPADIYIGGVEHAILHLMYARFFTKVLKDMKLVKFTEPFSRLLAQGMVTKDGAKMSKSVGNVVSPNEIIDKYGADTARLFMLFTALPEKELEWNEKGVDAIFKFLLKTRKFVEEGPGIFDKAIPKNSTDQIILGRIHRVIRNVTEEMEALRINFAVSAVMQLVNMLSRNKNIDDTVLGFGKKIVLQMLSPFAPHIAEELWEKSGGKGFVTTSKWPVPEKKYLGERLTAMDSLVEHTIEDIRQIIKLVGKKPKRIMIYTAPGWKHTVLKEASGEEKDAKKLLKELMENPEVRKQGKHAAIFIQKAVKENMPSHLSPQAEFETLQAAAGMIAKEFSCDILVQRSEESQSDKARRADPMKPGIEVQ